MFQLLYQATKDHVEKECKYEFCLNDMNYKDKNDQLFFWKNRLNPEWKILKVKELHENTTNSHE